MAAVLGAAAKGILAKLGGKAAGAIAKAVGIGKTVAKNPVVRTAAGTAGTVAVVKATSGGPPAPPELPPGMGPGDPGMPGAPAGGGALQVAGLGPMPITAAPRFETVARADKGYVIITMPNGAKVQVLKKVAYALGLRKKPRNTTRISSRDIEGAQKVNRFITKFAVNKTPRNKLKKGRKR